MHSNIIPSFGSTVLKFLPKLAASLIIAILPTASELAGAESRLAATSSWLRVSTPGAEPDSNVQARATPNATYLSVQLLASVLNPGDGWWTQFIRSNDQVGIVATVSADGANPQQVLSRFEAVQNRDNFQFSSNKVIIREQPLGRAQIGIELSLVATSEDGVGKMMNELVVAVPALGIATDTATTAAIGIAKSALDALFGENLLKVGLKSVYEVGELPSGVYAIFAAERELAYSSLTGAALQWSNGKLSRIDGQPFPANVSYMVIRVTHSKRRYPNVDSVFNDPDTDWTKTYREIRGIITPINLGIPNRQKIESALMALEKQDAQLTELARKANILIQVDRSLTQSEKDLISEQNGMMVEHFVTKLLQEQIKLQQQLQGFAASSGSTHLDREAAASALGTLSSKINKNLAEKVRAAAPQ